jgi:AcrR family transcriptional regulator
MNRLNDDTSKALVAAAHRLLDEAGPDALTVRRIANEAGMSTMNVYSRFGGKDGVIDVLYVDGFKRLFEALAGVEATGDAASELIASMNAYRTWALANRPYYGIMFENVVPGFEPAPDSVAFAWEGLADTVRRIELGQEAGVIGRFDDWNPASIATWLWATCHGIISLELSDTGEGSVDWAAVFSHGVRIAVHGLHPSVAALHH